MTRGAVAAILAFVFLACAGVPAARASVGAASSVAPDDAPIVVASKSFTESVILGEMLAQLLAADADDLVDPDVCLAFPHAPYPADAVVPEAQIRPILDTFKHLRFADETIYLRAGSVNIFNGIVGLNFSCDGSHYIPWAEFLDKKLDFWLGSNSLESDE